MKHYPTSARIQERKKRILDHHKGNRKHGVMNVDEDLLTKLRVEQNNKAIQDRIEERKKNRGL